MIEKLCTIAGWRVGAAPSQARLVHLSRFVTDPFWAQQPRNWWGSQNFPSWWNINKISDTRVNKFTEISL